jgi:hypothetical protein
LAGPTASDYHIAYSDGAFVVDKTGPARGPTHTITKAAADIRWAAPIVAAVGVVIIIIVLYARRLRRRRHS